MKVQGSTASCVKGCGDVDTPERKDEVDQARAVHERLYGHVWVNTKGIPEWGVQTISSVSVRVGWVGGREKGRARHSEEKKEGESRKKKKHFTVSFVKHFGTSW